MPVNYFKNIKVNVTAVDLDGIKHRTSTTVSYSICKYYFGSLLYPEQAQEAIKGQGEARLASYRKWLVGAVQCWVNKQDTILCQSAFIEVMLLQEIHAHGYKKGLDKNKDNL